MAHDKTKRARLRAKYVQGLSLPAAAEATAVPHGTARNWKRSAKDEGDCWDTARRARHLSRSGIKSLTEEILEGLAEQFLVTITAMRDAPDMEPAARAKVLLSLNDAYVKAMSAAARGNPALDSLAVAMDTIKLFGQYVAEHAPQHRTAFIELVQGFGPVVTKHFGTA